MATALGLVGIADKGTYSASVTYKQGNYCYYNGSSYVCVNAKGCTGITPSNDGTNWKFLARGLTDDEVARVGLASATTPGMVKVGTGIDVAADGTISAQKIKTWGDLAGK